MGGGLLEDLLSSGQLGVYQSNAYSEYSQRNLHQVSIFCSRLHQADVKPEILMKLPIGFAVEGSHTR